MSKDEKEALLIIVDTLKKVIAWDSTLGVHNITPMLSDLHMAEKLLGPNKRDRE